MKILLLNDAEIITFPLQQQTKLMDLQRETQDKKFNQKN